MRFYSDDERTTVVDWYFVDENTPMLGVATPFRSRNWDQRDEGWGFGLGEVDGSPRTWRNGSKVGSAAGTNYCGSADQWASGQATPPDPPVELDDVGTPLCCNRVDHPPPPPPLVMDCVNCPGGAAQTYKVTISGVLSGLWSCDKVNDTFTHEHVTKCGWSTVRFVLDSGQNWAVGLSRWDAGHWLVSMGSPDAQNTGLNFLIPAPDCLTTVTGTLTSYGGFNPCVGLPDYAFATVEPGPHQPPARS